MRKFLIMIAAAMIALVGCSSDSKTAKVAEKSENASDSSRAKPDKDDADKDTDADSDEDSDAAKDTGCIDGVDCAGDPFADAEEEEVEEVIEKTSSFAEAMSASLGADVSDEEGDCIVGTLVSELGIDGISGLESPDPSDLDEETVTVLGDAFDECLDPATIETLFQTQFESSFDDPAMVECMAQGAAAAFSFSDLLQIGIASEAGAGSDALAEFEATAQAIGIDCAAQFTE